MDQSFVEDLVDRMREEPEFELEVIGLRDQAWDQIRAGGGELDFITSTSSSGHSTTRERVASAREVHAECNQALKIYRRRVSKRVLIADMSGVFDS